jgi:hypothetical protein
MENALREPKPSRIRGPLKWVGLLTCWLTLCVWGVTCWWAFYHQAPDHTAIFSKGQLWYLQYNEDYHQYEQLWGRERTGWQFEPIIPSFWIAFESGLYSVFDLPSAERRPHGMREPVTGRYVSLLGQTYTLPLSIPFYIAAIPTAFLWRHELWRAYNRLLRRHPPGHCQSCGYNLSGNVSGTCPECGAPVPSTP